MRSIIIQLLAMLLPWPLRRGVLRRLLGYRLHPDSRVGLSLLCAERVTLGAHARIGHLNYAQGLTELTLGESARLGKLNWITAVPRGDPTFFKHRPERDPSLRIGDHAAVTNRHLLDCNGGITVGAFATFGGWRSQILTHSIDVRLDLQDAEPVSIGERSFVGTGVVLLKGARLPERSVLAAGSVLGSSETEPYGLYSGVPATRVRELDPGLAFFTRQTGVTL